MDEALHAAPTARTPLFNAYTPDSYQIEKRDLVAGLPERAAACGLHLRAILLIGPLGILWTYHVVTFISEGDQVRVTTLVIPHARLTGKGTGLVSMQTAETLLRDLTDAPLMRAGLPALSRSDPEEDPEFAYNVLLAMFDGSSPRYFHTDLNEFSPGVQDEALRGRVDGVLKVASTRTYRHGDRVPRP